MIDVNTEAEKALSALDCTVVYQHPRVFNNLPVVSYYNVTEHGAFFADNEESVQSGYVQIDVWTREGGECGALAIRVNGVMTENGWTREMSADIPENEKSIYHKTMRFHKYFSL